MAIAKAQTEVADIAGLVAGVLAAPPVSDGDAGAPRGGQLGEPRLLDLAEDRIRGVAQHIDMKSVRHSGRGELCEHRLEITDDVLRRLIADADQHCGRKRDRRVGSDPRDGRKHGRDRIAGAAHDEKADHRVPEADHDPRQRHGKQRNQRDVEPADPAWL